MSRYIDADALYEVVTEKYYDIGAGSYPYNIVAYDMAKLVKNAPTADVVEVRHGEWTKPSMLSDPCCSRCKRPTKMMFGVLPLYCPNCGAKMDGERNTKDET